MGKLVMGYWDCPFCGSKEIRGDVVNCPSCGRARGDVKFYMKNYTEGETREENERDDIEFLSEEESGKFSDKPDWYCSFCNSLNSDNAPVCGNCGASREDSEANYFEMLKKKQEREAAEAAAQPQTSQPKSNSKLKTILIAAALVTVALLAFFLWPRNHPGKITDFSWARAIQTEEYRQVTEEDWSVPAGGEIVSQAQKIHHYDTVQNGTRQERRSRQVLDHYETYYTYEDKGNGSFEQVAHQRPVYETEYYYVEVPNYVQVPRYQTAYTYTIWKWMTGEKLYSSGQDHNPVWPEVPTDDTHREANDGKTPGTSRAGVYRFTMIDEKGKAVTYRLNESDWQKNEEIWLSLETGKQYNVKTSGGSVTLTTEDKKTRLASLAEEK